MSLIGKCDRPVWPVHVGFDCLRRSLSFLNVSSLFSLFLRWPIILLSESAPEWSSCRPAETCSQCRPRRVGRCRLGVRSPRLSQSRKDATPRPGAAIRHSDVMTMAGRDGPSELRKVNCLPMYRFPRHEVAHRSSKMTGTERLRSWPNLRGEFVARVHVYVTGSSHAFAISRRTWPPARWLAGCHERSRSGLLESI